MDATKFNYLSPKTLNKVSVSALQSGSLFLKSTTITLIEMGAVGRNFWHIACLFYAEARRGKGAQNISRRAVSLMMGIGAE